MEIDPPRPNVRVVRVDISSNNLAAAAGGPSAPQTQSILANGLRASRSRRTLRMDKREGEREHPKPPLPPPPRWDVFLLLQRACGYISRIRKSPPRSPRRDRSARTKTSAAFGR